MHNAESWILSYLVNSLWQIPLLFVAGWIAARVLHRVGAAAEHRVWVTVLLLQTALPAVSAVRMDWLSLLFWRSPHQSANANVTVIDGAGIATGGLHLSSSLLTALALGYCVVTLWFAGRFVWRWARLAALKRDGVSAVLSGERERCRAACAARFGIGEVSVATSARVCSPITMGVRRSLVLLPAGMVSGMSQEDFQTIIAHEFAHICRRDFLRNLIYELVALPGSYHPLLAFTRERLMETREIVCDQMAADIAGPKQYARSLLRLASVLAEGMRVRTPHTIGIFDTNTLERRLMNLTERRTELRGLRRAIVVAGCVAFGASACASALALHMSVDASSQTAEHPPAHPTGPVAVSSKVMAGQRISGSVPKYPEEAKKARIQGTVLIDVVISKDGDVLSPNVVSGPKELRESALDGIRDWKYKPFLLNGEPVEVKTTIQVIYSLASKNTKHGKSGGVPPPPPPPPPAN